MKKIILVFMLLVITGCNAKIQQNNKEEYTIIDKSKSIDGFVCATALENFYIDENYSYYWNCIKDEYVVVKYTNNDEEKVSDALKNNKITIDDLDRFDIKYSKEEIKDNGYDGKSCEYIRTYTFLEFYTPEFYSPNSFFIIVDQFQMDSPMIIELNNNFKNTDFVKGENYEFTFKDTYHSINTTDGKAINKTTNIIKVEHTNKIGLDQTQNPCILK